MSHNGIIRKVMPELDTVRGIAVLLVFLFHGFGFYYGAYNLGGLPRYAKWFVASTTGGWTGVNLFFVLSGFLITGILLDSKGKERYFGTFYWRRALRILPAYYALLLLLPLVTLLPNNTRAVGAPFIGLSFLYLANLTTLFGVSMQYGPLWSLAVEEHFYLLWPQVVYRLSAKVVACCAAAIVILSPIVRALTTVYAPKFADAGQTWNSLDGVALGAIVAVIARSEWCSRRRFALVGAVAIAGSLALLGFGFSRGILTASTRLFGRAFRSSFIDLFFCGVLIFVLLVGTSARARWVNVRWLKFFGFISYGFYLLHSLAFDVYDALVTTYFPRLHGADFSLVALRFGMVAVVSATVTYISRRTFEEFFLKMKDRLGGNKEEKLRAFAKAAG